MNMKKRLLTVMLALAAALSTFTPSLAAGQGKVLEYGREVYEENLRLYNANTRTEESILKACLLPDRWVNSDNEAVIAKAAEITAGITGPYEKARAIYDWVCGNITLMQDGYVPDEFNNGYPIYTASGTLRTQKGDERGWSMLTLALMQAAGIPGKRVFGYIMAHGRETDWSWCEVFADGRWIIVDTAYDAAGGGDCFDVMLKELSKTHKTRNYQPSLERVIKDGVLVTCGDDGSGLDGITEIGSYAFSNNWVITEFTVPDGVTKIGEYAFKGCNYLTEIKLPDSVTQLGSEAFAGCVRLRSISLPQKLTHISSGLFWGTALREITIPNGVTDIDRHAFIECWSLKSVHIPSGVKTIGAGAFYTCPRLTEITIPASVTYIGDNAFGYQSYGSMRSEITIKGALGSAAETYARANGIPFKTLTETATPTAANVIVNGKSVDFDAYNIGGNNYFKLRDLAYILNGTGKQFSVDWDAKSNTIILTSGKAYTPAGGEMTGKGLHNKIAALSGVQVTANGKDAALTVYNIDGNNYFKLRDVGLTLDFGIGWDGAAGTISISTSTGYTPE